MPFPSTMPRSPILRNLLRALCVWGLLWLQVGMAADILVIESYHPEHPWDISYRQVLQKRLGGKHSLHFTYLDTKRLPRELFQRQADQVWDEYLTLKPQLVIIGDDNGIKLLAARIAAHGTPVVYLGMNGNPRQNHLYGLKNLTGVLERPLLKRNIREMSQLLPGASRALILFDASDVSVTAIDEEFRTQTDLTLGNLTVDIRLVDNYESWQQTVSQAKSQGYDMIFIGLYHTLRDQQDRYVDSEEVERWTGEHTPVPLFGFWDFSIGERKACGGLVMSGAIQGDTAATLALEVLAGRTAHSLPPRTAPRGEYLFSHKALARWKLQLPANMVPKAHWLD